MGNRSKNGKKMVFVGTDNPNLKKLEYEKRVRSQLIELAKTWEWAQNLKATDIDKYNSLHPKLRELFEVGSVLYKKAKLYLDIANATGTDINDVYRICNELSFKEIAKMAEDASKMYIEVDTSLTFKSRLKKDQINALIPIMNELVFAEPQTLQSVRKWLKCKNTEPVRVRNIGKLGYLLRLLAYDEYICSNWQRVSEECRVFAGSKGSVITQKSFSKALSLMAKRNGDMGVFTIIDDRIYETVKGLKG